MAASSHKLRSLLRLLWQNPLFGDSFPAELDEARMFCLFDDVYLRLREVLPPILEQSMPEASPEHISQIFDEIAPKSVAFCAAISAGEIEDVQRLVDAAAAIALSYWADQSIDRGDEEMLIAVQSLNESPGVSDHLSPLVVSRLNGLQQMRHFILQVNPSSKDYPYVLRAIQRDVLLNQTVLRVLSNLFLQTPARIFWHNNAFQTAQVMIDCSGLMSAGSIVYALYRVYQPDLSSLQAVYTNPKLQEFIRATCNPAVRIFDDAGDACSDSGENPGWMLFSLNVINQNHPLLVRAFLKFSGFSKDDPEFLRAVSLFELPLAQRRVEVVKFYRDLVRARLTQLPKTLWERYAIFLTLVKRILEASFVNLIGDVLLSEQGVVLEMDRVFLHSVQNEGLLPLERM